MTREVFFDTETTDMLDFKLPAGHLSQPCRLIEYALISYENKKLVEKKKNFIIPDPDPTKWDISEGAFNAHGISKEQVMDEGKPIEAFIEDYMSAVRWTDVIIAHNWQFESKVAQHELVINEKGICPKNTFCTMLNSTEICAIPAVGKRGFKWPKLYEAYRHFFNRSFSGEHSAMGDAMACLAVYRELQKLGIGYDN